MSASQDADESAPLLVAPADAVAAERQQTRGLCSKRTGLWILIGAVVLSGLAFAVTFLHPRHSRGPHEPHGPSLVREAQAEYVLDLLRELEKIAKSRSEYGGSRSTTRGHGASADFVVGFLQNHTDFRVWKQPFKVWGQVDSAKPVLVARPGSADAAAAAVTAEKVYAPEVDVGVAVGSASGALSNAIAVHVMGCEPVDLDVFKTRRSAVAVVGVDGSPARTAVSAASTVGTYVDTDPSVGPTDLPPRRLSPAPLGAAPSCPSACARAAAAVRAGAKAVILYPRPTAYGYPWTLPPARRLRCADPADFAALQAVPVVSMSQAAGWDLLLRTIAPEGLRVDLVVNSTYGLVETVNVLAETPTGDPDRVLVMGSHLDTVEAGPGVNDDGSGAMATLELAHAFYRSGLYNHTVQKVRFGWWGAEETGLEGSRYYVDDLAARDPDELARIKLTLDTDMIGSPNFVRGVWDGRGVADAQLRGPCTVIQEVIERYFDHVGLPSVPFRFNGRSDFASFMNKGIPAGGVITGEDEIKTHEQAELFGGVAGMVLDPCYHQACDTVESLRGPGVRVLAENLAALAHAMERFALEADVVGLLSGTKAVA